MSKELFVVKHNLTEHPSIDRGITEYEQILPIHLNISSTGFDSSLYTQGQVDLKILVLTVLYSQGQVDLKICTQTHAGG